MEGEEGHAATRQGRSGPAVAALPGVGARDARLAVRPQGPGHVRGLGVHPVRADGQTLRPRGRGRGGALSAHQSGHLPARAGRTAEGAPFDTKDADIGAAFHGAELLSWHRTRRSPGDRLGPAPLSDRGAGPVPGSAHGGGEIHAQDPGHRPCTGTRRPAGRGVRQAPGEGGDRGDVPGHRHRVPGGARRRRRQCGPA
ncbi:hypothetical protein SGPA1_21226 [Streptomyces misionensis JCM 4497]